MFIYLFRSNEQKSKVIVLKLLAYNSLYFNLLIRTLQFPNSKNILVKRLPIYLQALHFIDLFSYATKFA